MSPQETGFRQGTVIKEENAITALINELNRRHFVVPVGGKTCVATITIDPDTRRSGLTLGTAADLRLRYANRMATDDKTAADIWLTSPLRRQHEGIVFDPSGTPDGYFNLFTGFPVQPIQGDCGLFWEHVLNNICSKNSAHYRYLRKWLAHALQHPDELPGTAIVLRGQQGTGKGVFVEIFGGLFGEHYMTVYRLDQVTGRFNSHLKNVILLHANEATCRNDKVGEGVLKGLITDPTTPIEYKGKDIINIKNYKRIVVSTNDDWAVPMGMDDRRFLVLEVSSEQKEQKAYFAAIVEQMRNGGMEALMFDLLNEDLTDFDVRTVPHSDANFEQKLHSAPSIVQWWFDILCDGSIPPGEFMHASSEWPHEPTHNQVFAAYVNWCRDARMHPLSKPIFGRSLRKLLPGLTIGETRQLVLTAGGVGRVRVRCYLLPALQDCRNAFQRFAKSGPEIWSNEG